MRHFLVASLALSSTVSPAFADVEVTEIKLLPAGADPCKELGGDAKTCKKVATVRLPAFIPA
ncbi:MAG TPA: hypothetical protein VM513_21350 [Kofleriaceae bacterium]|jgi:hypothetical protein|nr:hypothetical protein [Kofleriaceae bacterium]